MRRIGYGVALITSAMLGSSALAQEAAPAPADVLCVIAPPGQQPQRTEAGRETGEQKVEKPSVTKDVGSAVGGTAGQIAGAAVAGPIGAAAGGVVAERVGRAVGGLVKGDKKKEKPQQAPAGPPATCVPQASGEPGE